LSKSCLITLTFQLKSDLPGESKDIIDESCSVFTGEDIYAPIQSINQGLPALHIIMHYVEAVTPEVELQPLHLTGKL